MVASKPIAMVSAKKPNRKNAILAIRPPKRRNDRKVPTVLRGRVGSAFIVAARWAAIQMQVTKKKAYQMLGQRLSDGAWRDPDSCPSGAVPDAAIGM
jgi:hypothetical protein